MLRLTAAALGLFMFAAQAVGQESRVAAATDADVIAVYSRHVEKRLLRAHFDRSAARLSLAPFGPTGVETFVVAPNGAFVVYSATREQPGAKPITYLFLLDEAGNALGEPLRSPVGPVTDLAVSPQGDRIAAGNDRGWLSVLAIEGSGTARRLASRAAFGVSADRQFSFAFRPDGGLVTIVDDWMATWRSNDGAIQRTLDLKTINRELSPAEQDIGALFQLTWSPRGDRFAVSWGPGPMVTTLFDSNGRRLRPAGTENWFEFGASKIEFVDNGDAVILYGMAAPVLVRGKALAATAFGDPAVAVDWCAPLGGGHEIAVSAGDQIALWSLEGKQLTKPVGLENYHLGTAVAGAKDEVIVAAERSGWLDLYNRKGEFLRRVQSGLRDNRGFVAISADGATLAALGADELGVISQLETKAWKAVLSLQGGPLVAVAADGSRIVAEGPDNVLRSWSRDGIPAESITLKAGDQRSDGRLSGLAVSTNGDAIAVAEEGSAVWLARPADKTIVRVALAARSVAPLPDGAGFAIGLADGTVARLSRDGTARKYPFKASELGAVGRIAVAADGESFIAVEDDERQARHLAWDGRVLGRPYRAGQSEMISGAFFHEGTPKLVVRNIASTEDEAYAVVPLAR